MPGSPAVRGISAINVGYRRTGISRQSAAMNPVSAPKLQLPSASGGLHMNSAAAGFCWR